ncbi:tripartite tricarboxylate transporter substrate binding protein [Variovorax guangxiensis]|uniref:Bug family tripartite tricarboxylate transporter substrate binding protein n=1 Tax=Variovorax guangxiensis TaxID=1775474 RepID=UPI0028581539|nr:tripartite tricarboxylate transporter substrate binding protein [Variovorax guangxiensis]MDR6859468.1 tripartite-type tricarboxylate transporter receptor subunit TctC [Variovorax guangxiensis]
MAFFLPRLLLAAALGATLAVAHAQSVFPSRPIKVVVTTPVGVTPDVTARLIATKLGQAWSMPVVVDNKPGAGGTIAADAVAKAAADGYTLLFAPNPIPTMAPHLYSKLPYAQTDLQPITIVAQVGYVLLANKDLPVSNMKELAEYVKARPGAVSYASYGVGAGTHLLMEKLAAEMQVTMLHVPYKTSPLPDLMSGQVQLLIEPFGGPAVEAVKAGRLKPLGVTMKTRSPALPKVPSISETFGGFESVGWLGFWVPAKTPVAVVQKYHDAIAEVMAQQDVQNQFRDLSIVPVNTGPVTMAQTIERESGTWGALIRRLGIKMDGM